MQTATTSASATTLAQSQATGLLLSTIRRHIMHRMNSAQFTPAERLRANDSVYQCDDVVKLTLWHKNVCRVEVEREIAQATEPITYASNAQKQEVLRLCGNQAITRQEKTKVLLGINRLTKQEAEQAITALAQAIWERDNGQAAHLSQLVALLNQVGIAHRHLLAA